MSVPPPPNQWGSQPPTGGQPLGAQWGPPPGGQQGGAPQWGPQQPWGPPPRGGKGKWILGGIAVLAVIAVTVVITVLVVGKDSGESPNPTPTNSNGSDFASANDQGPVGIITEEPTCSAWNRIADKFVAAEKATQWRSRDSSIPSTQWMLEQRSMYESVGKAMDNAASEAVNLVKVTPHRVVRELYEQFIAYARTFNQSIPQYKPDDNYLAGVVDGTGSALVSICAAITYDSAATQAPFVPKIPSPSRISSPGDPADPQRFLSSADSVCTDWLSAYRKFDAETADWRNVDPNRPATEWTPEEKVLNDAVAPMMTAFADQTEAIGRRTQNPVLQDWAMLSAQYRRAFVRTIPTYTPADNYLVSASTYVAQAMNTACLAAGA
jgi:hypothetical protein